MPEFPIPPHNTRLGFHYYPDLLHFREGDLSTWLPEIKSIGASWLTMLAPGDRAIPESFLTELIASGIEPILHFNLPLATQPKVEELGFLFETYAKWGVHYIVLYDRPNRRNSWPPSLWTQSELVERFLDRFLPLGETVLRSGMVPVFPPLMPGGDYWDTSFLRDAIQAIDRRGHFRVLENLVIGAYAIAGDRPLTWGSGGPERWPKARPYYESPDCQDQRGLFIHEWYAAIGRAVIGETPPQILFGLSSRSTHSKDLSSQVDPNVRRTLAMAQALAVLPLEKGQNAPSHAMAESLDPMPSYVLAGNFWLLTADPKSLHVAHAWFQGGKPADRRAEALQLWRSGFSLSPAGSDRKSVQPSVDAHPIQHYLLLPAFEWGISDWHINAARPFIRKYRPTIGFSFEEARLAVRVTVLGSPEHIPDSNLDALRSAGCMVERIDGDGMSIATQLSEC
jgi:hypothetical protein